MDTFKDRQQLEEIYGQGNAPWEVWKASQNGAVSGGNAGAVGKNGHNHHAATPTTQSAIDKAETRQ